MREKRLHLRVPVSHPVLCEPEPGESFAASLVDLGLAGACIESAHVPTFGTRLVVALRLPGATELSRLPAVVRWTKAGKFGVQFGLLGARDTKAIADLMAQALHRDD
jgi:hypothetical protein